MDKNKSMGKTPNRNEQFERLAELKNYYRSRGWPVISVDTKKKELLGEFDRAGAAWLHRKGITGRGVAVAVLDSGLTAPGALLTHGSGRSRLVATFAATSPTKSLDYLKSVFA